MNPTHQTDTNEKLIGQKRERAGDGAKLIEPQINASNVLISKQSSQPVINLISHNSQELPVEERAKSFTDDPKNSFPNINDERRIYLTNLIDKIEKANNNINKSLPDDERWRRTTRDKICFSLVRILIIIYY
jgi:hypothetical protein